MSALREVRDRVELHVAGPLDRASRTGPEAARLIGVVARGRNDP